jgi:hypothetical protein
VLINYYCPVKFAKIIKRRFKGLLFDLVVLSYHTKNIPHEQKYFF